MQIIETTSEFSLENKPEDIGAALIIGGIAIGAATILSKVFPQSGGGKPSKSDIDALQEQLNDLAEKIVQYKDELVSDLNDLTIANAASQIVGVSNAYLRFNVKKEKEYLVAAYPNAQAASDFIERLLYDPPGYLDAPTYVTMEKLLVSCRNFIAIIDFNLGHPPLSPEKRIEQDIRLANIHLSGHDIVLNWEFGRYEACKGRLDIDGEPGSPTRGYRQGVGYKRKDENVCNIVKYAFSAEWKYFEVIKQEIQKKIFIELKEELRESVTSKRRIYEEYAKILLPSDPEN